VPDGEWASLDAAERRRAEHRQAAVAEGMGYREIQRTRPHTLGYGLADSPVGQLAWIIEKFMAWADTQAVPEDAVERDLLLTNVMCYWLTNTATSAARLYWEAFHEQEQSGGRVEVPVGVAVFSGDYTLPIRRLAERRLQIVRWTEYDRGGHFAALEEPELLINDIRDFLRSLRPSVRD
jgi:epoxide hydrolase